jgi:two-component system chemotaxis sensor kinase CheA
MSKHVETYRQEAEELLADIEEAVLDLEQNPEDYECINRLFRAMHTIKGSGAMFGFDDIVGFTHHVETVLEGVRDGNVVVSRELVDLILASTDQIKVMLDTAEGVASVDSETTENIVAALQALLPVAEEKEELPERVPYTLEMKPDYPRITGLERERIYRIRFQPHPGIFKSGMDPAVILDNLRALGECMVVAQTEAIPPLEKLSTDECHFFWDIILTTSHDVSEIKDVFIFVEDESHITIQDIEDFVPKEMDQTLPKLGEILVEKGDADSEKINEALSKQKRIGELLVGAGEISPEKLQAALDEQKALDKRKTATTAGSVRVASEKLDRLINLVGELVINQAHLTQVVSSVEGIEEMEYFNPVETLERLIHELANPVEEMERLANELRDCALNMRMFPIGSTFGKFRRLVRDLSTELGKEVDLVTVGGETELDKTVIERLNDPLVHLIRNSIDHGIQTPEEREKMTKPHRGTICLSAAHRGTNVVINIGDDGVGMDPEAIKTRAVEKGLIAWDAKLSEKEIFDLVFMPGFSTVKKVSEVSGRGIGLDVVKREIDSLGGSIQINSKRGQYHRVNLSLPLTLAIIDGLLVDTGGNCFILPLSQVDECTELTEDLIRKRHGRNMILVRKDLIPFIRMSEVFNIPSNEPPVEHIAIVQIENSRIGIVVDEIIGNIQTVIKSLDKNYRNAEGISGATIMGDGRVALIVDISGLIRCATRDEEIKLDV